MTELEETCNKLIESLENQNKLIIKLMEECYGKIEKEEENEELIEKYDRYKKYEFRCTAHHDSEEYFTLEEIIKLTKLIK